MKSIFTTDVIKLAQNAREADTAYEQAFRMWAADVPPLDDDGFWNEQKNFHRTVLTFSGLSRFVELAADEHMRRAVVDGGPWDFVTAAHFAVTYERFVARAQAFCGNVRGWGHADRSDDGFSDLCDNLPMVGRELFERLEAGEFFHDGKVLIDALCVAVHAQCHWTLVWENHWSMTLRDAVQKWLKLELVRLARLGIDLRVVGSPHELDIEVLKQSIFTTDVHEGPKT